MRPRIGVVIPCRNQGEWLPECLASLRAQSLQAWSALVIDDASDDGHTRRIVADTAGDSVAVLRVDRNLGLSAVRNEGLSRLAELPYFLTLDADDHLAADYLERLLGALDSSPDFAVAHGTQVFFGTRPFRTRSGRWPVRPFDRSRRFVENPLPGAGALWRTDILRRLGGWSLDFSGLLEDWELGLRLLREGGSILWVREAHYHYRQHASSITNRWSRFESARFDALLLRHHRGEIRTAHGARKFARRRLAPALMGALRAGRWGDAARLLRAAGIAALPFVLAAAAQHRLGHPDRNRRGAADELGRGP